MTKGIVLLTAILLAMSSLAMAIDDPAKVKTIDNLKAAFTGETTASAKYAAYAKKAADEGFTGVAALFSAASKSESIHAANHAAVLEQLGEKSPDVTPKFDVKATAENLQDAVKGETYEVETMYPEFLKNSAESKTNIATISFNYAYQTEQNHKILYTKALENLKKDDAAKQYFVCPTCGNTYETSAPKRCSFCMTPKDKFVPVG